MFSHYLIIYLEKETTMNAIFIGMVIILFLFKIGMTNDECNLQQTNWHIKNFKDTQIGKFIIY